MPIREGIYIVYEPRDRPAPGKMRIYRSSDRYEPIGFGRAVLTPVWNWACNGPHAHTDPVWFDERTPQTWEDAFSSAEQHAFYCHGVTL